MMGGECPCKEGGSGEGRLQPFLRGRVSIYKGPFFPLIISSANTSQVPTPCQVISVQVNLRITKGTPNTAKTPSEPMTGTLAGFHRPPKQPRWTPPHCLHPPTWPWPLPSPTPWAPPHSSPCPSQAPKSALLRVFLRNTNQKMLTPGVPWWSSH